MNDDKKISILVTGISVMVILVIGMWGVMFYGEAARDSMSVNIGKSLKAMVKGSIYSDGEYMSVFGTCTNEYDMPLNGSSGYLRAWYPNGTQFIFNDTPGSIAAGYFVWNGNMQMVGGTYLTEFECLYENQTAKAWGEWQNPEWVRRISIIMNYTNTSLALITDVNNNVIGINATVTDIENMIAMLNLSNLSVVMNFTEILAAIQGNASYTNQLINISTASIVSNISFLQMNMTSNFNYTNTLILAANQSWNSNTTLIAQLLYLLMNQTSVLVQQNLTSYVVQADSLHYWQSWNVKIGVRDITGKQLSSPTVYCYLNNTITGMQLMTPEGSHFDTSVFINTNQPFYWSALCYYS